MPYLIIEKQPGQVSKIERGPDLPTLWPEMVSKTDLSINSAQKLVVDAYEKEFGALPTELRILNWEAHNAFSIACWGDTGSQVSRCPKNAEALSHLPPQK